METSISRRRFLSVAGTAGALSALALTSCSRSEQQAEPKETLAEEAISYSEPLGFPTPIEEAAEAVWKVDYVNDDLPADYLHDNWRMSIDSFPADKIAVLEELGLNTDVSNAGMDTLQAIGGADFTAKQFDWILATAEDKAGVTPDKLTVLDLRGETHGLIDGNVFMYWVPNNCVNESIPTEEVIGIEADLLAGLKELDTVAMYQTVEWNAAFDLPMLTYEKPEIMTEEELVTSKGATYVRFADTNHFRPDDHEVDLFVDFMKDLPADEWLFMHCYAGEGRTTCFMVMTDIFKNYKVASFDDIAARQGLIGPVDVRTEVVTTGKSHYKKKASVERRIFLQQFYQYATDTDFTGQTWTEWARDRGLTLEYYAVEPKSVEPDAAESA